MELEKANERKGKKRKAVSVLFKKYLYKTSAMRSAPPTPGNVVSWLRLVIFPRRFGTTYLSHPG
jgi:hypothetical protein